jgi:hypothetical protein
MNKQRVTHNDLAMHLGLNVRHVRKLIRAGMPAARSPKPADGVN